MKTIETSSPRGDQRKPADSTSGDELQSSGEEDLSGRKTKRPHYTFVLACGIGAGAFATALVGFTTRSRPDAASMLAFTAVAATLLGAFAAFLFGVQSEEPEIAPLVRSKPESSRPVKDVEPGEGSVSFSVEMDAGFGANGAPQNPTDEHTARVARGPLGLRRRRHTVRRSSLITHQHVDAAHATRETTHRWEGELESERGLELVFSELAPWTPETSLHLTQRA